MATKNTEANKTGEEKGELGSEISRKIPRFVFPASENHFPNDDASD